MEKEFKVNESYFSMAVKVIEEIKIAAKNGDLKLKDSLKQDLHNITIP